MPVVTVGRSGDTTRITLSRPDKANALNPDMVEALIEAVTAAATDGTRFLVLDAEGRHFCAGFDLGDLDSVSEGDLTLRFVRIETLLQSLHHLPFPTLALARGRAMGAGADIFCACSRRIAAPETRFRMPGLAFGIVLGTRRLAARIGDEAARRLQNETRAFDAAEAVALGFATETAIEADWPGRIAEAENAAAALSPEATRALCAATVRDTRAQDMADLAASASHPGLKARIQAYRDGLAR